MKFKTIILIPYLLLIFQLKGQNKCGDDIFTSLQKNKFANYDEVEKRNNLEIKNYIDTHFNTNTSSRSASTASVSYVIPVVFHIIHQSGDAYGTGTNISYAQIVSQVNALNAAYGKNYPIYNGQSHASYAQNTNIQFCLAKIAKPSGTVFYSGPGGLENGVMRYADNIQTNHQITSPSATSLLALTHPTTGHFPFSDYLNIWVVSSINSGGSGTTMGYAPKPIMGAYPLDGVVMRSDIIGDNTTGSTFALGYGLTQGKILAHEVGHYLNLYHIFQGGCAGTNAAGSPSDACDLNGDGICDIEPCTTQNISCGLPIPNTCSATYATGTTTLDMIESYMSYADDDCMNTFTANQTQRLQAHLNLARFNLWQTSNLSSTGIIGIGGCISPFLMSNINPSTNNICAGTSFQLSNPIGGNSAISWNWTMTGGSPSTATTSSVNVTYSAPGLYWAYLSVSNGTITTKDSLLVKVANCSLDTTRLDRAHWFFSNYAEINFNTPVATPGTSALTHTTITGGYESTVSMSDKKGNLLFYTNSMDFWDENHTKINLISPIFPVFPTSGSSTPGVIAIPFPKDSSKYIIISSPHSGVYYDSIFYVVYDINTKVLTPKRGFINPLLPTKFSEPLTVVPHCNGIDYWVICRAGASLPVYDRAYSILITPGGPNHIGKVTVTNGLVQACCGQFKSNRKGNKLISANYVPILYDFDQATGLLKNETPIGTFSVIGNSTGAIFSPNDSLAYAITVGTPYKIHEINLTTLATKTISTPVGFSALQMECGPDNNIYVSQGSGPVNNVGRIINTNSWTIASYVPSAIVFAPGIDAFGGMCNFMDADKKMPISNDYMYTQPTCNTFKFTVDSCWQVYKVFWDYGDGTTGLGLLANHTYTLTGSFSVKMTLSCGTYSLTPVIKNITVLSSTTAITGPSVICKGSTFINSYGVSVIPGAVYNWSISNGNIVGPNTLPNINVGSSSTGISTLSVQIVNGGCTSIGTKTLVIDTVPKISPQSYQPICLGNTLTLSALPVGGVFIGTGVTGSIFNSTIAGAGIQTLHYSYANSNGCTNVASISVTVNVCSGINDIQNNEYLISIFPNPNIGEFNVTVSSQLKNGVIEIYNYLGQLIVNDAIKQNFKVNLVDQSNGIYFVRILENNKLVFMQKVIKQ